MDTAQTDGYGRRKKAAQAPVGGGAVANGRKARWADSDCARRPLLVAIAFSGGLARADSARHFSFAYDQPHSTGYGIAADLFNAKLMEMSHGSMAIDQFPGAQLGQEPQMLQKIRTGDIDFMISSTANAATVAPESGVLSIHYLFRSEDQLIKAIGDPRLVAAVREMFDATVKDGHVLALATLGLRDLYGKRAVASVGDLKNAIRSAYRQLQQRTLCSPPMARKPSTCRSAASTRRCRPASSTSPRMA